MTPSLTRRPLRTLTLLEVVISTALLSLLGLGVYGTLEVSRHEIGATGRAGTTVHGSYKARASILSVLRSAPYRLQGQADWPAVTPTGWVGTTSPAIVKGTGNAPDALTYFTTVAQDSDGDGMLGAGETGLGAAGVLRNYYRLHVTTIGGRDQLVREVIDGTSGNPIRREVLAGPVSAPLASGTADERRGFLVDTPTTNPRFFTFRLRLGHVTADTSGQGRSTYRHERRFSVNLEGD